MDIKVNRNGYTCVTAKVDWNSIYLVGFGDLHAGSETYNEKKAKEVIRFIKEETCVWVGMGDFCENANKRSIGSGVYTQVMTPDEQIPYIRELLKPIADKCIGYIKGNHEERAYKDSGIDIANLICYELNMPYCYWEFFGCVAGKKRAYSIYAVHSAMGNRTAGLALNATERDIEKMVDVDIIMRGHCHKNIQHISEAYEVNARNNTVTVKQRANLIIGHYLDRDKSYAAAKPYRGDPPGTIALQLDLDYHRPKNIKPVYL